MDPPPALWHHNILGTVILYTLYSILYTVILLDCAVCVSQGVRQTLANWPQNEHQYYLTFYTDHLNDILSRKYSILLYHIL